MVSIATILISLAFFCGFGVCQLSEVAVKDPREEVIEAWYMFVNQRLSLHRHPKEFLSLDKLAGYFDVPDSNGAWIRIWVKKGGLIVVPAGIYHRFTLDSSNNIKAIRLFAGDPIWTAYNRPDADQPPARSVL
ncbi:acireductone dioxygenase 3-like [Nicotiana tabacum]|uniref:acireductone dioxygenase (Fe(2+)-requiring) n=1 Tax=Nicotiana tabacum TaxID=4097 RepID=A0A1S4A5G7_TOBAC|nr:PREDICTED: 1,2-dihydroxy-3-keto-5-methylthiopentene dioxygenase 3-like [Nicotiana tabacum]